MLYMVLTRYWQIWQIELQARPITSLARLNYRFHVCNGDEVFERRFAIIFDTLEASW